MRTFQDALLSTQGIVEIEQYCDALFSELDLLNGTSGSFFLFDDDWNQLYPYDGSPADPALFRRLADQAATRPIVTGVLPGKREPQIFAIATSRDTGWTLLIGEPSGGLAASVLQYAVRIALLALIAITCSLAASYFIARRVTVPLKALHSEIEALDLGNLDEIGAGIHKPDLGEIDELRLAFRDMRLKLNESIQEAVSLRAHEKEAQLVALQSQLNPHFIHNMLQTIGIMAEEGSSAAIQDLIVNLARMLRYVSSTEATTATLGTEIEYAESYLAGMRARFGESLEYVIDVRPEMTAGRRSPPDSAAVHRELLQVRNHRASSLAHRDSRALRGRAVVHRDSRQRARVRRRKPWPASPSGWPLRRQAGSGLSPMSISGMGIVNSCERLRLAFGDEAAFEITNRPDGGARIVMGAVLHG